MAIYVVETIFFLNKVEHFYAEVKVTTYDVGLTLMMFLQVKNTNTIPVNINTFRNGHLCG